MRNVAFLSALVAMSGSVGCGSREHAPFLQMDPGKGTGGSGGGDAGETGGRAAIPSGGRGGKSSTSGTGGAPVDVPPWGLADGFDQSQVYLLGDIEETPTCNHTAVSLLSDPNLYAPGFPCTLPIRFTISNGKLYYEQSSGNEIHEFVPDYSDVYPSNPLSNDPKINAPCSALITGYLFNPSGTMIYHCLGLGWHDVGGATIYEGDDTIVAFTDNYAAATSEGYVLTFDEMVPHPVPALTKALGGVRVHEEEFHYAIQPDPMKQPELWSVDASGTTTKLGDYPAPPAGVRVGSVALPVLAPDDSLYMAGSTTLDAKIELIYRRTIDGTSKVVYTEADDPVVTMNRIESPMITGP